MFPIDHSRSSSMLLIVFSILAVSYLVTMNLGQYPLHFLHKASPIIVLMLATNRQVFANHLLLVIAILFSAFGDILLALQIEHGFVMGLGAFLIAQCCYGLYFQRWRDWQKQKWPLIAALILLMVIVASVVIPASGSLLIPVTIYMLAIFYMACSAILVKTNDYRVLMGALFFVISDSLIAINKFVMPLPFEGYWVMSTYYIAQYLIVTGCLKRIHYADGCN